MKAESAGASQRAGCRVGFRVFALAVLAAATAAVGQAPAPRVEVGLDRLEAGEVGSLAGRRLGLVVHAASVTAAGRHAIDVLRERGLGLERLFTPEHGLRGRAAAGESVAGGVDPVSGLPVVSLYGDRHKPTPEDLSGLDALVFDLQGAGVRFYTYVSTLILCLEAAAENDLLFVVLDRPNPLGGERIEGPLAAPRGVVPASFVNLAPGPLVHGLTLGEMARWVNRGRGRPARLSVVGLRGWSREMAWVDTGLPWVAPSPNLRSAEAALAYPGTALLEATNVSEGRGTDAPFLRLGAPWWTDSLSRRLARLEVPGFELSADRFTPTASPAAPLPKYRGVEVTGSRVRVSAAAAAEPYRLGVALLAELSRHPGFEWRRGGAVLTWLLGTPALYDQLAAGRPVAEIVAADREDHAAWRIARRPALLY